MKFSGAGTGSRLLDAGQQSAPPEPRDWRRRATGAVRLAAALAVLAAIGAC